MVWLLVALVALVVAREVQGTYRDGKSGWGLVQPSGKRQRLFWGLQRRMARRLFYLKRAIPRVGGVTVVAAIEWPLVVVVGGAPALYNVATRWEQIKEFGLVFWATVGWFVLFATYAGWTRIRQGRAIDNWTRSYAKTANAIGGQIEGITRLIYARRVPGAMQPQVREVLLQLLAETCEVVKRLAAYPGGTEFCAAIQVPEGADKLQTIQYSPASCKHLTYGEIRIGDPGVGIAFAERELKIVEDTLDPSWGGFFKNPRYRSFVAFPIMVWGRHGQCLGCVTIDSSEPYVLTDSLARNLLFDAVRPQLESIGLALMYAREKGEPLR